MSSLHRLRRNGVHDGLDDGQVFRAGSRATWLVQAGANPKDVQGLMRHSRISTTLDIYAQVVADSQRAAIAKVSAMVTTERAKAAPHMAALSRMIN